jgi:hypothetical protein
MAIDFRDIWRMKIIARVHPLRARGIVWRRPRGPLPAPPLADDHLRGRDAFCGNRRRQPHPSEPVSAPRTNVATIEERGIPRLAGVPTFEVTGEGDDAPLKITGWKQEPLPRNTVEADGNSYTVYYVGGGRWVMLPDDALEPRLMSAVTSALEQLAAASCDE